MLMSARSGSPQAIGLNAVCLVYPRCDSDLRAALPGLDADARLRAARDAPAWAEP